MMHVSLWMFVVTRSFCITVNEEDTMKPKLSDDTRRAQPINRYTVLFEIDSLRFVDYYFCCYRSYHWLMWPSSTSTADALIIFFVFFFGCTYTKYYFYYTTLYTHTTQSIIIVLVLLYFYYYCFIDAFPSHAKKVGEGVLVLEFTDVVAYVNSRSEGYVGWRSLLQLRMIDDDGLAAGRQDLSRVRRVSRRVLFDFEDKSSRHIQLLLSSHEWVNQTPTFYRCPPFAFHELLKRQQQHEQ
jgi:hypothetical protein